MPYKIVEFDGSYSIQKDNMSIPRATGNRHYQMFIEDIALGNDTVEGPDVREPSYVELRQAAYPSMAEQLDMQYWDGVNGTTIWADAIQAVKDQYPTSITGGVTVGDVPDWVQEEADAWLFEKQTREYGEAVTRLAQYQVALGREEVTEMRDTFEQQVDEDGAPVFDEDGNVVYVQEEVIVQSAIEPVEPTVEQTVYSEEDPMAEPTVETIENPLITQDNEERAAAQAVVDATPQAVIDAYNAE
jgi:hypothetical protein